MVSQNHTENIFKSKQWFERRRSKSCRHYNIRFGILISILYEHLVSEQVLYAIVPPSSQAQYKGKITNSSCGREKAETPLRFLSKGWEIKRLLFSFPRSAAPDYSQNESVIETFKSLDQRCTNKPPLLTSTLLEPLFRPTHVSGPGASNTGQP